MKHLILLLIVLFAISCDHTPKECVVVGEVIGRHDIETLRLYTSDGIPRVSEYTEVPVSNGKFQITLPADQAELMKFIVEDDQTYSYESLYFFKEADTVKIQFRFNSLINAEGSTVEGGSLQKRYEYLNHEPQKLFPDDAVVAAIEDLERNELAYTDEAKNIYQLLHNCETETKRDSLYKILETIETRTPAYTELMDSLDMIHYNYRTKWFADQAKEAITEADLAVMRQLFGDVIMNYKKIENLDQILDIYEKQYRNKFRNNPMVQRINELLCAWENIKIGGKFIDFEAPSIADSTVIVRLSDEIKDKVAVIDMWASWCSPCIRNSMLLIPVYEKYKKYGFTVVSIARETGSTDAAKATIERCKFPWTNLIELNNANRIWYKYGISYAAGSVFLVNKEGEILLINPSAEEVERKLSEIL